jgi:hypothetical protein
MHYALRTAPLAAVILLFVGCFSSTRQEESTRVLERRETPTADGGKVVKETEQNVSSGQTKVESPIDVQAILGTAMAGIRGDLAGVATNLTSALARSETAAHERQRQYEAKVSELTSRLDMVTSKVGTLGESVAGTGSKVEQANKAYEDAKKDFERKLAEKAGEVLTMSSRTGFSSPEAQGTLASGVVALLLAGGGLLKSRKEQKRAEENEKAAKISAEYADSVETLAQQVASLPPEEANAVFARELKASKLVAKSKQTAAGVHGTVQRIRGKG